MQKLINVLALASFAVSACVVGAGAYIYTNQDAIKAKVEEKVKERLQEALGGGLPSAILSSPAEDLTGMDETGAVELPVVPFSM